MRYCPNRQCPFLQRHGRAAEYVDAAQTCSDCDAPLTETEPSGVAARRLHVPPHWSALAWTLPLFVVPFVIPYFRLPGLKLGIAPQQIEADLRLSPFALGIQPFLMAFLLVELVALAVPRWRPLRVSGPAGRARLLSAVWKLAFLLCLVQAFARVLYFERAGFMESSALTRLWAMLSTVASTSLLVLIAQLAQRNGVGGGLSVLCAALLVPDLAHEIIGLHGWESTWPAENPSGVRGFCGGCGRLGVHAALAAARCARCSVAHSHPGVRAGPLGRCHLDTELRRDA